MGKSKKYKNQLVSSNKIINVRDLTNEVNKCDKFFDVKLRNPNVYNEPEQLFNRSVGLAENYISGLIVALNGIDIDEYFTTSADYGTVHGPIGTEYDEFTDLSTLEWNKSKKYETSSLEYRCRFITIILSELMYKIEKISLNKWKKSKKGFGMYEYGYINIKKIVDDSNRLIIRYLAEEDCSNSLIKMNMIMTYSKNKVDSRKLNRKVFTSVQSLRDAFKFSIGDTDEKYLEDDVLIYTIIRLAYMLATNDYDFKNLPVFKQLEYATQKHDLSIVLQDLGAAIINQNDGKRRPAVYKAYNDASPLIWTNYRDINIDYYMISGLRAVNFVDYIINDKRLHEFIYNMTHDTKL